MLPVYFPPVAVKVVSVPPSPNRTTFSKSIPVGTVPVEAVIADKAKS